MPLSYNNWPASPDPSAIGINTAWEPIPGHRFPGGVKAGDVETVLTYVVRQLNARVEPIDRDAIKDEWGYAYKASANSPNLLSCHASGTAFDYNATRHPNGHRGTFTAAQVAEIRKIQYEVGGVVRWLGDAATRTADEMHFEIHGTPAEVAAVAARLREPPPPPPLKIEEDDMPVMRRKGTDDAITIIEGVWWMSTDGGISSTAEIVLDESAWAGITGPNKSKIKKV